MASTARLVVSEPLPGKKRGHVLVKEAQGVQGVGRQLREPCGGPRFVGLEFGSEPTNSRHELLAPVRCEVCKGWRVVAGEGEAQAVVSLGTGAVAQLDWKGVVAEGTATTRLAQLTRWRGPQCVVARPPETLKEEKPIWRTSNPEREEARVASR